MSRNNDHHCDVDPHEFDFELDQPPAGRGCSVCGDTGTDQGTPTSPPGPCSCTLYDDGLPGGELAEEPPDTDTDPDVDGDAPSCSGHRIWDVGDEVYVLSRGIVDSIDANAVRVRMGAEWREVEFDRFGTEKRSNYARGLPDRIAHKGSAHANTVTQLVCLAAVDMPTPAGAEDLVREVRDNLNEYLHLTSWDGPGLQVVSDVKAFHRAGGVPVLERPAFPSDERVELRRKLLVEEADELLRALDERDLVEVADGLADLIYIAVGTALELGINMAAVWGEVHRSNMAKFPVCRACRGAGCEACSGRGHIVHRREDGKVLKPEGWTPPLIDSAMRR